jgi:alpha-1,4-N-acetylglucosaminyltransferase EXTL3
VRPEKNSLQNRFLPFDLIRTDAVTVMDDDVKISGKDLTFGFWAWREQPTRLMGYVVRNVGVKDRKVYIYQGQVFCDYNIILTGASILHKYYLYVSNLS